MSADGQIHGVFASAHVGRGPDRDLSRPQTSRVAPDPHSRLPDPHEAQESVREFVGVLWRRRIALLLPIVITPILAFTHAFLQDPVYASSADVLVTSGGVASALSELPGLSAADQPERNARTQIGLARLPRVAQRVITAAPTFEEPQDFLARSSVSAEPDADILRFSVEDLDSDQAMRLATIYAREFTLYRNSLDLQAIRSTQQTIQRALARLAAGGGRDSRLYGELRSALRQLEAAEAVQGTAAIFVQPAVSAVKVRPTTFRDIFLGLALGILLGVGLAFLVDRLDTRVRSSEAAEAILGLPVLGELSQPPALPERAKTGVSMVEFPYGHYAEGVRKLRSNVEFANLDIGARILMVTSSVVGEGKTTVASNLAVALARSGRTVALCDLDPRAPAIHRVFALGDRPGLVEVAFGLHSLEDALVPIEWVIPNRPARAGARATIASTSAAGGETGYDDLAIPSRAPAGSRGHLNVLPLGRRLPPSPADFVGSATVQQLIAELAATHEIVILDTPPLLPVSDSLTISGYAEAALLVCGLAKSRRPGLRSVQRLLSTFPTRVLGFVATGVPAENGYGPYFATGPDARGPA